MIKTLASFILSHLFKPESVMPEHDLSRSYHEARRYEHVSLNLQAHPFTPDFAQQHKQLQNAQRNAMWNYLDAALKGHTEAQYKIGLSYLNGNLGMDRNYRYAEQWLLKAKQQGHPKAATALAQAYNQLSFS